MAAKVNELANNDYEATLPGHGAKTSDYYQTESLPNKFNNPDVFKGYGSKQSNPMYITSANEYGSHPPTVHTMPYAFHSKNQKFSEHLGQCGMYRNYSLNTSVDKNPVSSHRDGLF
ncbi:piercer of microtubule wall 1 protein isoform X1 [Hydra vulgaris]|uniref:UPF0691 protein C9orf116 n=1 Tax=Hydra vulgaris TaxID=6087 RepID=T2MCT7_HYDVU|nr:UPF0691 protein C9orf116 homolog isoform X1 [Hydra vulgaris]